MEVALKPALTHDLPVDNDQSKTERTEIAVSGNITPPPPLPAPEIPTPKTSTDVRRSSLSSTTTTSTTHLQYLDSLVPPSPSEFLKICHIQEERERQHRRRSSELRRRSLNHWPRRNSFVAATANTSTTTNLPWERGIMSQDGVDGADRSTEDAARIIQRTYRGYRTRRELEGVNLNASTRWVSAIRDAQWIEVTRPKSRSVLGSDGERPATSTSSKEEGSVAAREHWKKAAAVLRRANLDIDSESDSNFDLSSLSSSSSSDSNMDPAKRDERRRKREAEKLKRKQGRKPRMMALQYFLEMVDHKHRYGTNLRVYHEVWKDADTHENFFYWLDHGGGKDVDMAACPRDQLDKERVRYLSREERLYYLVEVDSEGRLRWAKNGELIDTTTKFRDSIHGIVPVSDPTPPYKPGWIDEAEEANVGERDEQHREAAALHLTATSTSSSSSSSGFGSSTTGRTSAEANRYITPEFDRAKGVKKLTHISASTITNKLLRKTVRKNTWIFVADNNFRLYVGIKDSGSFQHSSFLQGSRIGAAGLIKIKNGKLRALSPLSGHYRPPASNFRTFVKNLREAGVDMGRVSISKSYMVLAGLELYVKTSSKGKRFIKKLLRKKEEIADPEAAKTKEEDQSKSAQREREVVAEEKKETEEREELEKAEKGSAVGGAGGLLEKLHISGRREHTKEVGGGE